MGTIRINNLRLRCIIGFQDWEREKKQDVIINIAITLNREPDDDLKTSVLFDYKTVTKSIISYVESSECNLVENLCKNILSIIYDDNKTLLKTVTVSIKKPNALRCSDSISYEMTVPDKS